MNRMSYTERQILASKLLAGLTMFPAATAPDSKMLEHYKRRLPVAAGEMELWIDHGFRSILRRLQSQQDRLVQLADDYQSLLMASCHPTSRSIEKIVQEIKGSAHLLDNAMERLEQRQCLIFDSGVNETSSPGDGQKSAPDERQGQRIIAIVDDNAESQRLFSRRIKGRLLTIHHTTALTALPIPPAQAKEKILSTPEIAAVIMDFDLGLEQENINGRDMLDMIRHARPDVSCHLWTGYHPLDIPEGHPVWPKGLNSLHAIVDQVVAEVGLRPD